jgi:hypothetical protein
MNKIKVVALLLYLAIIGISACSPKITVSYDYDKQADFTKYTTYSYYGWAKGSEQVLNRFDQERIEDAVAAELNARGFKYVESDGELTVSLFIQFDQKTGVNAYTNHYGGGPYGYRYGPGWGWGYGYSTTTYQEYDYLVGTLVIDIFDHQQKSLIWQGVGSKTVDGDPDTREKNIQHAVKAIMANYPVKPLK